MHSGWMAITNLYIVKTKCAPLNLVMLIFKNNPSISIFLDKTYIYIQTWCTSASAIQTGNLRIIKILNCTFFIEISDFCYYTHFFYYFYDKYEINTKMVA